MTDFVIYWLLVSVEHPDDFFSVGNPGIYRISLFLLEVIRIISKSNTENDKIVCAISSDNQLIQFTSCLFFINSNITHHLKLEIVSAILSSNERKIEMQFSNRRFGRK